MKSKGKLGTTVKRSGKVTKTKTADTHSLHLTTALDQVDIRQYTPDTRSA